MGDSIFLQSSELLSLAVVALLAALFALFVPHKGVRAGLHVSSFLCVAASVVYALLLGAQWKEVLLYLLVFTLAETTAFLPLPVARNEQPTLSPSETRKTETSDAKEKAEQAEEKHHEL